MSDKRKRAALLFSSHVYGSIDEPFIRLALRTKKLAINAMIAFADEQISDIKQAERDRIIQALSDAGYGSRRSIIEQLKD